MPEAKVSAREYAEAMRAEFERLMDGVAAAVNDAPDGRWIRGSEEKVRDLFAGFRQAAYQRVLQMRADAAEASFPPSGGRLDGQGPAAQGPGGQVVADDQRGGGAAAAAASEGRRAGGGGRRSAAGRRR